MSISPKNKSEFARINKRIKAYLYGILFDDTRALKMVVINISLITWYI
jgi:hypothetical protein